ncbi:MAG: crossover junction endodeoxyribonuclease RuvC [Candidatus Eisenbacteria bacterium]|uniref:Crossover junction endodeoxyribonuclease RuvC n=1 Tax=Eiseniibacteriota bacterium TaxID=2212470 RepID=A0A938BPP4_UNCEI|nr:crossover junction endodeoxyribonuclease RuvC [Candidatus Eisenbacteria bacterium]
MRILGLDPGSLTTGYGLIAAEPGRLCWRASGLIRPPRGEALAARLQALHQGLTAVLQAQRPDVVALEDSFVGRHARTALVLGHARGALIVAALAAGVPVVEYAPRLVKLAVTGAGGARKEQVLHMVGRLLEGAPEGLSHDETDALAVAICHAHRSQPQAGALLAGAGRGGGASRGRRSAGGARAQAGAGSGAPDSRRAVRGWPGAGGWR